MRVFAVYSPEIAGLVKTWAESWSRQGWKPQLLSAKEIEEAGGVDKAIQKRRGGLLSEILVINFGWTETECKLGVGCRVLNHGKQGWQKAALVRFPPGVTEEQIRGCGLWH